jgi:hypothetical protein
MAGTPVNSRQYVFGIIRKLWGVRNPVNQEKYICPVQQREIDAMTLDPNAMENCNE